MSASRPTFLCRRLQEFKTKFNARFNYVPDHNGIKGYTGVYAIAYATKKIGKFDRKARRPPRCTA